MNIIQKMEKLRLHNTMSSEVFGDGLSNLLSGTGEELEKS